MPIRLPLILLLLLAAPLAWSETSPRAQLDRFAADLDSLSASFSQVTVDADGRIVEQTEGRMYYSQPNRFRWSYLEPFPQEMVADGERLWHYDESLDQVTVRDQPAAAESPLLVLTQPELLDRFYRIEASDQPCELQFSPLGDDGEFEYATLFFADDLPEALELIDRFGQLTRLELYELQRNPALDPELFTFVVPPGADLLEGY